MKTPPPDEVSDLKPPADLVWLEAEHFADFGGWTADWQFLSQMGSAYLMAIGYGKPVADAVTRITPSKPGPHRLWVRSRDWVPEFHPGRFTLSVGGRPVGKVFGESGADGWRWEDAGVHPLTGDTEIRLIDLSGYYGRVDAIAFSPDLKWAPPEDRASLDALRIHVGAVASTASDVGAFDLVVVGGGLAGCLAAVAAARGGARTALLHNRLELGGNASREHMVPPVGATRQMLSKEDHPLDPLETGLLEELDIAEGQDYFAVGRLYPSRLDGLVRAEPKLFLFPGFHVLHTGMKEGPERRIASVLAQEVLSGKRLSFAAERFIDASGDGILGLCAGADMAKGREARSQYGETKAPVEASPDTLGNSLKYWYVEKTAPVAFDAPPWADAFPTCGHFPHARHPIIPGAFDAQWMNELGGDRDTWRDAEEIRDRLLRLVFGLWGHAKNHCGLAGEKTRNLELAWVSHVVSVRESFRLLGDAVMTERDITGQVLHPDRVAYGAWGLDDHPSKGFFDAAHSDHTHKGLVYSIPLRALYSRNIANLFMAGRNISASHVAMTATRVMRTTALMGQAVGTAAAMCARLHCDPRDLANKHVALLQQQLLKDGAFLVEMPNADPLDLARQAQATASSASADAPKVLNGYSRARLPHLFPNASREVNAWVPEKGDKKTPCLELAWEKPVSFNAVHLTFQSAALAPRRFSLQVFTEGTWKTLRAVVNAPRRRRFVFPLETVESTGLRVCLEENPEGGGICEIRTYLEDEAALDALRRAEALRTRESGLSESHPETGASTALPWEQRAAR